MIFASNDPVVPNYEMNSDLGNFQEVSLNKKLPGIVIEVDYAKICDKILGMVKRTAEDLITSEALIDAFMELTREMDTLAKRSENLPPNQ